MVWQEESQIILMITNEEEKGKVGIRELKISINSSNKVDLFLVEMLEILAWRVVVVTSAVRQAHSEVRSLGEEDRRLCS